MPNRGRNVTASMPILHQPYYLRTPFPVQHTAQYLPWTTDQDQGQTDDLYPDIDLPEGSASGRPYLSTQRRLRTSSSYSPVHMQERQAMAAQRQQELEQRQQLVQALRPFSLEETKGQSNQVAEKTIAEDYMSKLHEDDWDPDDWTASLHCSVCFEFHSESYVLQCGHTWCNTCIESMVKAEKQRTPRRPIDYIPVVCPSCRHSQPYGQYSRYAPRNRALEEAVDAWRKSPDRAKLLVMKDDIGVQAELNSGDLEKALPPDTMLLQTEEWKPEKTFMSIGHQVCLPAEGSTVGTQTTRGTRDAEVQTTPTKQRTKCIQTMFTRTRASGVQVGPPGGFQNLANAPTTHGSTSNTAQSSADSPQPATVGPAAPLIAPLSQSNPALDNMVGPSIDRSQTTLPLTPPPTPSSPASSNSNRAARSIGFASTKAKKRLSRSRIKRTIRRANKMKKTLLANPESPQEDWGLEDFLGDDLAAALLPLMGVDVAVVVLLVFHLVIDWRHVVSAMVTDAPTIIGSDPYYTTYTINLMGDAISMCCIGALGFLYSSVVLLRDAGCWLLKI